MIKGMNLTKTPSRKKVPILLLAILLIAFAALAVFLLQSRFNPLPQILASTTASKERQPFPEINASNLSEKQQSLIALLKQEYSLNPEGAKYSQGVNEAWCADFVSWIYNETGTPLENPNSGSWRIPGTYTLREYYESQNRLRLAGSGYSPKVGDIMLYDNPSPFGQHTNIVIKNDEGVVTTIGGNEPGGIRIITHTTPDRAGFIGYGVY